jgi:4-hydroxy 2-oxovalerate aldolase
LSFDDDLIERLFCEYQDKYCDDSVTIEELKKEFVIKKLLLLGPGKTLMENGSDINIFIKENDPVIISINFLHESFPIDYVFMGNAKRFSQFFHQIYTDDIKVKIICTSNITEPGRTIDYVVNYFELLSKEYAIRDNPLVMFLHLLKKIGITELWLAGFDGYTADNSINYYGDYIRLLYTDENVILRNKAMKKELGSLKRFMRITSLTPTRYL